MSAAPLRIAVGIATHGRPALLQAMLRQLARQTRPPDRIVVCYSAAADIAGLRAPPCVELLPGREGLTAQRNVILAAVGDCDALLYLDDDFLPAPGYLAATIAAFAADPVIVVTTGVAIADGINGPGLSLAAAQRLLLADHYRGAWPGLSPTFCGYGCNMAIRLAPVRRHALRFDEAPPLYAWYEDLDFTRRLGRHGRTVRVAAARGVHLGSKSGRTSGRRLGYSQVVNPLYLAAKRVFPLRLALRSMARNMAANLLRAAWPERYVDRRGRLLGNLLALGDLVRGRADPRRVLFLSTNSDNP